MWKMDSWKSILNNEAIQADKYLHSVNANFPDSSGKSQLQWKRR